MRNKSNKKLSNGVAALFEEFRAHKDKHDTWGSVMAWHFAVADYIYFVFGEGTPAEWDYSPGIGFDDDVNEISCIRALNPSLEDLIEFGNDLNRAEKLLRNMGLSY